MMANFPNRAGDRPDNDEVLRAELNAAGIQTMHQAGGHEEGFMADLLRNASGEVKTSVIGVLHGWEFKRAWRYWICTGPGIELKEAQRLQDEFGQSVRAAGDGACRGPLSWYKGLACGLYHVDDAEGLKALAQTISAIVERAQSALETA